jgi:hypothetical protein
MSGPTSRQHDASAIFTKQKGDLEREALNELDSIGFSEILEEDSRPTFVLDLDSDSLDFGGTKNDIRPIFCNATLRLHDRLLDAVTVGAHDDAERSPNNAAYEEFRSWATSVSQFDDSRDVCT